MPRPRLPPLRFRCSPPHPPVNFTALCRLLELELALGQTRAFRIRLRRALDDARQQADLAPFE